jgi:hypothetical protein
MRKTVLTCSPSTPSTCRLKNTSAIRSAVTPSSFSCRRCGLALIHSSVLLRRILVMEGRGGVLGAPFSLPLPFVGLPLMRTGASTSLSLSTLLECSGTLRKSEELREWPSVFFSRSATSFAGDIRVCGSASSSIVFPRCLVGEVGESERLRREMEVKLRSLRFYGFIQHEYIVVLRMGVR